MIWDLMQPTTWQSSVDTQAIKPVDDFGASDAGKSNADFLVILVTTVTIVGNRL